jgi:hypothetical protein
MKLQVSSKAEDSKIVIGKRNEKIVLLLINSKNF